MSGAVLLLPLCALILWTRTSVPLTKLSSSYYPKGHKLLDIYNESTVFEMPTEFVSVVWLESAIRSWQLYRDVRRLTLPPRSG